MPVRNKTKKQYVEHNEEHLGEDMKPFVAFWATPENLTEKNAMPTLATNLTMNAPLPQEPKRKVRFWRKLAAFFS